MAQGGRSFLLCLLCLFCVYATFSEGHVYKDSPVEYRNEFRHLKGSQARLKLAENRATDDPIRLPTALKPSHQLIRIQPTIGGNYSTFGFISIDFDVLEETNSIEFHMLDIISKNQTIEVVDKTDLATPLPFTSHAYNVSKQVYIGTLQDPLIVGHSYTISMEFEGYLNEILAGFYRSVYQDENDQDVYLATTHFEATDARRAFPCFDEPALKVTFDIEIGRNSTLNSISNMPLINSYEDGSQPGIFWDIFDTSVPMSTYLVAMIVSDFVNISRNTTDGRVLFRIWSRSEAKEDASYALEHGPDILSFYEGYYYIPFPLPKQDMAAIPDFSAGAMENWGLITYRETYLLYNPLESSARDKMLVDQVMAHELAHQWFGDLVTMEWWSDLWLNEGFASYMEYLGTDSVSPTYDMFNFYPIYDVHPALSIDSLESSHPISIEVNDPVEIDAIFDTISYSKGCSVIRMMKYFLTEATFAQALTNYLNDNAYGNAKQDDLWDAMTTQAWSDGTLSTSISVKEIMDTWTLQVGYPVVNIVINGDGTADLTKERFLRLQDPISNDTADYRWWVPITWTAQDNPVFDQEGVYEWMTPDETSKQISGLPTSATWFVFNVDQASFYRVNYEASNWLSIINQLSLNHTIFSILTRSQLIDDSMQLSRAIPGQLPYSTSLGINNYLGRETEYVAWYAALNNLEYLEQMFTNTTGYPNLSDYMLDMLIPFYTYIGFDDFPASDPHLTQLSRSLVVSWVCHFENADCVNNADTLYAQWMLTPDNNPISPNLKSSVYCTGIANGGQAEWDFALDRYLNTNVGNEKDTLLYQMGCSKDSNILTSYLDLTFKDSDSPVKSQDDYKVWYGIVENDDGNAVAWDYLNQNWDEMAAYYGGSYSPLAGLAADCTYEWNTPAELQTLKDFRDEKAADLGSSVATVDEAIKTVENNIAWMDNYYDIILQWLIDNGH